MLPMKTDIIKLYFSKCCTLFIRQQYYENYFNLTFSDIRFSIFTKPDSFRLSQNS